MLLLGSMMKVIFPGNSPGRREFLEGNFGEKSMVTGYPTDEKFKGDLFIDNSRPHVQTDWAGWGEEVEATFASLALAADGSSCLVVASSYYFQENIVAAACIGEVVGVAGHTLRGESDSGAPGSWVRFRDLVQDCF